jgi:hypothetical protein
MELSAIEFSKKNGSEEIVYKKKERRLIDFWQWAYSDLIGNTERGNLAEYLVAIACDTDEKSRISWDSYDLELDDSIKIEVKSSAYLQTWKQKDYSKIIFNIPKTYAWDCKENIYEKEKKRHADVYVFALLAHKDKITLNPLDTNQWEFYVLNSTLIDDCVGNAKQITLEKLLRLKAIKSSIDDLKENIILSKSRAHL